MEESNREVVHGAGALCFGSILCALIIRSFFIRKIYDLWAFGSITLSIALAVYLLGTGIKTLKAPSKIGVEPNIGIRWGRALTGSWLTYTEVGTWLHPTANQLQPSNANQAIGYYALAIALMITGLWLIVSGLIPKHKYLGSFGRPFVG